MNSDTTEVTRTLVQFDLAQVLTPEELEKFQDSAKAAGAQTLTDHFLNLTLGGRKELLPEMEPEAAV